MALVLENRQQVSARQCEHEDPEEGRPVSAAPLDPDASVDEANQPPQGGEVRGVPDGPLKPGFLRQERERQERDREERRVGEWFVVCRTVDALVRRHPLRPGHVNPQLGRLLAEELREKADREEQEEADNSNGKSSPGRWGVHAARMVADRPNRIDGATARSAAPQ